MKQAKEGGYGVGLGLVIHHNLGCGLPAIDAIEVRNSGLLLLRGHFFYQLAVIQKMPIRSCANL